MMNVKNNKPGTTFLPLEKNSLKTLVEQQIREAIMSGAYQPGERLVESAIATQLGVSRAPIREVLSALEKDGLVVSIQRRGSYVTKFSATDIDEIYSLRLLLEAGAIHRAIERITDPEIARMQEIVDALGSLAQEQPTSSRIVEQDLLFHEAICQVADHSRLYQVWNSMRWQTQLLIALTAKTHYEHPDEPKLYHQAILHAIRTRDATEAEKLLTEHIRDAQRRALQALSLQSQNLQ